MKQTAFRLNDLDIQILDETVKKYGLTNRTEALRYILREHKKRQEARRPIRRRRRA